jgi:hypothetical protein
MVDDPGSTALTPPREPVVDIFYVDGGCSRIFVNTRQGGGADVLQLGGSCPHTTGNASQEATMSITFLSKYFFGS